MMFSECTAYSPPASLSPPMEVNRLKDHELRGYAGSRLLAM
jgi:hypothetical protein